MMFELYAHRKHTRPSLALSTIVFLPPRSQIIIITLRSIIIIVASLSPNALYQYYQPKAFHKETLSIVDGRERDGDSLLKTLVVRTAHSEEGKIERQRERERCVDDDVKKIVMSAVRQRYS